MMLEEFLLARVADEESLAEPFETMGGSYNSTLSEWEGGYSSGVDIPRTRIRAQGDAIRESIAYMQMLGEQSAESGMLLWESHAVGIRIALRKLAAIWRDHPDWNEEWQ